MLVTRVVTVGTEPTRLAPGATPHTASRITLIVRVPEDGDTIFIGAAAVDTDGLPLEPGDVMTLEEYGPRDALHAVVTSGTQDVKVLEKS